MPTTYVPATYTELYEKYYPYVVSLVAKVGINPQDAEDVAQSILIVFWDKDVLSDYDPNHSSSAVFKSFLSGFVLKYLRHYLTQQRKRAWREPFSVDAPVSTLLWESGAEDQDWMNLYGPKHEDYHDREESDSTFDTIRLHLMAVPPRNRQDRCDLVALFNAVVVQTMRDDALDTMELADQFGVSKTSIQNWMKRLRAEIRVVMEAQQW